MILLVMVYGLRVMVYASWLTTYDLWIIVYEFELWLICHGIRLIFYKTMYSY